MEVICKKCEEYKKHKAHGLCKACYNKQYKENNPERVKKWGKKHYLKYKERRNENSREYRIKNKAKIMKYDKKYRENNKEKRKASHKKWKIKNPEKVKENRRRYRLKNPEKVLMVVKKWRKENPNYHIKYRLRNKEKRSEYDKNWRKLNPEKMREYSFKNRARGTIKNGIINKIVNENILKYGIITCEKCKKECCDNFHIDHIIPVSKKGNNNYDNLQVLCSKCNIKKHVHIVDYRQNIEENQLFLR